MLRNQIHHLQQLRCAGAHSNDSGPQDRLSLQECIAAVAAMTEVMQRYGIDTNEINDIQVKLKTVIHGDKPARIRLSEVEFVYVMMETLLDEFHQTVGSLICHFYDGPPGSGPVLQDSGDRKAMVLCGGGKSKGVVEEKLSTPIKGRQE